MNADRTLTPQSLHGRIQILDFIDDGTVTPAPIGVQTPRRNTASAVDTAVGRDLEPALPLAQLMLGVDSASGAWVTARPPDGTSGTEGQSRYFD